MTKVADEIEISPPGLLLQLLRRWWLLVLCGAVCAGAVFLFSCVLEKEQYQTSVLFYISNRTDGSSISSTDIDASRELVDHYAVLLKTGPCLKEIIRMADVKIDPAGLEQMLTAEAVGDTAMLRVNITGTDPQQLNAVAEVLEPVVSEFLAVQLSGSSAAVVDPPADPVRLTDPERLNHTVLGFCAGVALCALVILIGQIKKAYLTAGSQQ